MTHPTDEWRRVVAIEAGRASSDPLTRALLAVAVVVGMAVAVGAALGYCTAQPAHGPSPRELALVDSLSVARHRAAVARARVETVTVTVTRARDRWLAAAAAVGTVTTETPPPVRALLIAGAELEASCGELVPRCGAAIAAESTRAATAESLAVVRLARAVRAERGCRVFGVPCPQLGVGAALTPSGLQPAVVLSVPLRW